MTKSENGWDIEKQVDILLKQDDSKQIAYGVVYEPLVKDAHDDYMTADEIETACLSEWETAGGLTARLHIRCRQGD